MKNILVTGGAGYIGSHTVVELITAGYHPIIIDNFANSERSSLEGIKKITGLDVTFYERDFMDKKFMKDMLKTESVDGVIHFAALKAVGESVENPLKYYANNVSGFIGLLELLEEASISSLVFSSSCTVYGQPDKLPITENSPLKPAESPYGATKQICEIILRDSLVASKALRGLALRYFNPIGAHPSGLIGELPRGVPSNLVPYLTQTVAGIHKELVVHGNDYPTPDGTCIRDYINVVDLARAHVQALKYLDKQAPQYYDVYNIGTGRGNSVLEIIQTFEQATSKKVPYRIGPRRTGDVIQIYADTTKANKDLGWQAEKSLKKTLADAWRWQESLS